MKKFILIFIFCLITSFAYADLVEVTISWNPSIETDLKEYRLYQTFIPGEYEYGENSENFVVTIAAGTETITIFVEEEDVDLVYWVITAVDIDDLESAPSSEACIEDEDPSGGGGGGGGGCFIITIKKRRAK